MKAELRRYNLKLRIELRNMCERIAIDSIRCYHFAPPNSYLKR
jgi:hypothetical protein